jgi:hypothetical protein
MNSILNKINVIRDLYLIIYSYLSSSHKYVLNIKNNKFCENILVKYDPNLICCCIKKNMVINQMK